MMEGGVLKGKWINKAFHVAILILTSIFIPTLIATQTSEELQCPDGDYLSKKNICCNKCYAGFKLVEECHAPGQRSNCTPCPAGQYSDSLNSYGQCRGCRQCKNHAVVESECQRDRNTICRCENGYFIARIDSGSNYCKKCSPCGANEEIKEACTPDNNTVCKCKPMYYRVDKQCEPCKICTAECVDLCTSLPTRTKGGPDREEKCLPKLIGVAAGALILLVLVAVITHWTTKRSIKKKLLISSSQTSNDSSDSCEKIQIFEEPSDNPSIEAVPLTLSENEQQPILPDCVPLEIKISDLIYMVLDQVPVLQVKQLVRLLGVKDTEIEQAELDYRSCREAHYQMLRLWAEKGSRAGGLLHLHLLQELVVELRKMHLEKAAEELETNFGFQ